MSEKIGVDLPIVAVLLVAPVVPANKVRILAREVSRNYPLRSLAYVRREEANHVQEGQVNKQGRARLLVA